MEEILNEYKQKAKDYLSEPEHIVVSQWFDEIVNLAVSKERERKDAQILEFIRSGKPAPWNDTGWSVELSDVEKFIINTK